MNIKEGRTSLLVALCADGNAWADRPLCLDRKPGCVKWLTI